MVGTDEFLDNSPNDCNRFLQLKFIPKTYSKEGWRGSFSSSTLRERGPSNREDDEEEDEEEEEYDDGILEMVDEDGNPIRFYLSASIHYAGEEYVLLTCAEQTADIEQDESFIMRCVTDDDGETCYQSLEDEALIAAVYEAYLAQNENA